MPEAWRQRQIGQESDEHRANHSRDSRGDVDSAVGRLSLQGCEHACVDHEDIGHGHEGGETGKDLSPDGGAAFFYAEKLFHRADLLVMLKFRKNRCSYYICFV